MRLLSFLATLVASSSIVLGQINTWETWQPSEAVTTTVTFTLLHVTNETVTSTSYSHAATGYAPHVLANATSAYKPALTTHAETPTAAATIASYSAGAAAVQEVNVAVAGLLGIGALAYGMF